jgi:hypothetical protein
VAATAEGADVAERGGDVRLVYERIEMREVICRLGSACLVGGASASHDDLDRATGDVTGVLKASGSSILG